MTEPTKPIDELEAKLNELKKQMIGRHHADLHVHGDWGEHIYEADWLTYLPELITADRQQLLDRVEKASLKKINCTRHKGNTEVARCFYCYQNHTRNKVIDEQRIELAKLRKEYLGDE